MSEEETTSSAPSYMATTPSRDKPSHADTTPVREEVGWNIQPDGDDTTLKEQWDPRLPQRPSMKKLEVDEMLDSSIPMCVVFNANTVEGSTMVRVLSEKGLRVVAVVRVFTGRKTKELIKLNRVAVKVADWNDRNALHKAAEGCERAFIVTRYWERFDSRIEEQMCSNILEATSEMGVQHFVMATFEDTLELRQRGLKSQLMPDRKGRIFPKFEGMKSFDLRAKELNIQLSHMMTSYLDADGAKKSLILIRGPNGKVIVQPYFKDPVGGSTTPGGPAAPPPQS